MDDDDVGTSVDLYVYDLTQGMAKQLSPMLLGRQLDGLWHTSIVAYGREYFFGTGGVSSCQPSGTVLGEPDKIVRLGDTFIPYQVFLEYILGLGETTFRPNAYDLIRHNCNNFSNEVSQFLSGTSIPREILDLPSEVLNTPLGRQLRPVIDSLCNNLGGSGVSFGLNAGHSLDAYTPRDSRPREESPDFVQLNSAIDEVRRNSAVLEERRNVINEKLLKKEKKEKKKKKKREKELNSSKYSPESSGSSFGSSSSTSSRSSRRFSDSQVEGQDYIINFGGCPIHQTPVDQDHISRPFLYRDISPDRHCNGDQDSKEHLLRRHSSAEHSVHEKQLKPKRRSKMADAEAVVIEQAAGEELSEEISKPDLAEESTDSPAEAVSRTDVVSEIEAEEKKEVEEKKRQREPPIIFRDEIDLKAEFEALENLVIRLLNEEEIQSLDELRQYSIEDEGSWALGDGFLNFVGRLLHDKSLKPQIRVTMLKVLAASALKDDVILLLHQDRRDHVLMNYAHDIDRLSTEEQEAVALFVCNLFENLSSSEWLLYISEWQYCNSAISNIRVTTKVAVHSLLSDSTVLQDKGSAIIHNLACKEVKTVVFDDVAVELTMAILQFFNSTPSEEHLFRTMKALARFCHISQQDVPQLIQMIGPEPSKFKGASERVDDLISQVNRHIR